MTFHQRHFSISSTSVKRPRAFTLVELLIVIGIIAVLMGFLLPAMGRARQQAKLTAELAASRQLMVAYLSYATDNRGALIPGHTTEDLKLTDDRGKPLSPTEAGKRWPWRLGAHVKYGLKGTILVNEQVAVQENRSDRLWAYYVSLLPSFGLNYYNLGGDLTGGGVHNMYGWVKKITQVERTTRLIVFASSRAPIGMPYPDGYFKIVPPTKSSEYSATGWSSEDFRASTDPGAWGYVDFRWNGRAVVACLDGHSELLTVNEMRDMTRWSNEIAKKAASTSSPSP